MKVSALKGIVFVFDVASNFKEIEIAPEPEPELELEEI